MSVELLKGIPSYLSIVIMDCISNGGEKQVVGIKPQMRQSNPAKKTKCSVCVHGEVYIGFRNVYSISLMPRFTGMRGGAGVGYSGAGTGCAGCAGGAGLSLFLIASRWWYTPKAETTSPPTKSIVTVVLLLDASVLVSSD